MRFYITLGDISWEDLIYISEQQKLWKAFNWLRFSIHTKVLYILIQWDFKLQYACLKLLDFKNKLKFLTHYINIKFRSFYSECGEL